MKLKSILYILMLLPFLWSCNNEDDVEEIFASGTWQADGKDRTVNINFTKTPSSTSYNNEFIEALNNAIFYQGDSNVLLLAPEGKKTYIQFAHNKQD